jgi:3'-phosphoadenosine 5'-phosphosulfate sulfotransferase (PAPS reductase)/FAD synthetase
MKQLLSIINKYAKGSYCLPKIEGKKNFYVVPMSGGIDSFVTAYVMRALFPERPITYVHCDTGIEAQGTEEALEEFEKVTGAKILRLKPKVGLLEGVEKYGNFLPSQRARSCTQSLKVKPIRAFYDALKKHHGDDSVFIQMVGLRADEPKRKGLDWQVDHIASSYPLQSLGLTKSDVNSILSELQGIPFYYLDKSRSGCKICIFSRRSEIIAAWGNSPGDLERAAHTEDIPQDTLKIYNALPTQLTKILGVGRNHLNFYRPEVLGEFGGGFEQFSRGKNKLDKNIVDLFGGSDAKKLYVAIEYHFYANSYGLSARPHVFFEKLISYSTTLGGIKTALKHWWLHRLHTKELYGQSESSLNGERQVFIMEIEVDDFEKEIPPTPIGVFTWQNDRTSLFSIRKTTAVLERILLTAGEKQAAKSDDPTIRKMASKSLVTIEREREYGRILSVIEYQKPAFEDLVADMDITDAPVSCVACSR